MDVEINISTVPYEDRRAMCVVAHDVTGRLRAERALGEIRDAERNRIARELHDSILQDIVYALQEIQVLQVTNQNGLEPALGDAADALRRSVEGLRGAIFELRIEQTLEGSLVESLENLVDLNRRMARGAYEIELVVGEGVPSGLPKGREIVRIVQEALTNVRRHSGPGTLGWSSASRGTRSSPQSRTTGAASTPGSPGPAWGGTPCASGRSASAGRSSSGASPAGARVCSAASRSPTKIPQRTGFLVQKDEAKSERLQYSACRAGPRWGRGL